MLRCRFWPDRAHLVYKLIIAENSWSVVIKCWWLYNGLFDFDKIRQNGRAIDSCLLLRVLCFRIAVSKILPQQDIYNFVENCNFVSFSKNHFGLKTGMPKTHVSPLIIRNKLQSGILLIVKKVPGFSIPVWLHNQLRNPMVLRVLKLLFPSVGQYYTNWPSVIIVDCSSWNKRNMKSL